MWAVVRVHVGHGRAHVGVMWGEDMVHTGHGHGTCGVRTNIKVVGKYMQGVFG